MSTLPSSMNSPQDSPAERTTLGTQIESAYSRIGLTSAHIGIVAMVLFGVFFDAIEQNAVGISGPVLRADWGLGGTEIGLLNTATFTAVALGRILA
ncbi:MAG: MFS transporter, partial [Rhodococcus fascians]